MAANGSTDAFADHRTAVAMAIQKLRSYKGKAGSPEIKRAHAALDHLGMAYSVLQGSAVEPNPAWNGVERVV